MLQPTFAIRTALPLPPGIWQQPKQSQPFGMSGAHVVRQIWDWEVGQLAVPI